MCSVNTPLPSWNLGPYCETWQLLSAFSRHNIPPSCWALVHFIGWFIFVIKQISVIIGFHFEIQCIVNFTGVLHIPAWHNFLLDFLHYCSEGEFSWFVIVIRHRFRGGNGTCACVLFGRKNCVRQHWEWLKEELKGSLIRTASKSRDRMWHVQLTVECMTMVIRVCVFCAISVFCLHKKAIDVVLTLSPRVGIAIQGYNQHQTHTVASFLSSLWHTHPHTHTQLLPSHECVHRGFETDTQTADLIYMNQWTLK